MQLRLLASEHIVNAGRVEVATERLQRNAEAADKGSGTIKRIDVNFERLETFRELAEQFEIRRRYAEEKATSVLDAQEAIIDAKYAEQEAWKKRWYLPAMWSTHTKEEVTHEERIPHASRERT